MDVACVQEVRWRGSGCRLFGAIGKKYKLFWMGSKAKADGVGIFIAEKWVDSVVSVERHSKRALVLKMVLGDCQGSFPVRKRTGTLRIWRARKNEPI